MQLDLTMKGVKETMTKLNLDAVAMKGRLEAAVFTVAGLIASDAMKLAPFRTGELRESRFVTRTMPVMIGFGAPYAAYAHEVGNGAGKKFLQRALSDRTPRLEADIARTLRAQGYAESRQSIATAPSKHPDKPHGSWSGASADAKVRRRLRPSIPRRRP